MGMSRISLCAVVVCALAGCDAVRRIPAGAHAEKVVEVAVFEGGYGIEWHQKIADFDRPTSIFIKPFGRKGAGKFWR